VDGFLEQLVRTAWASGLWWQAILLLVVGVAAIALVRRYGGPLGVALKAAGTYLHSVKPSETTLNPDGSHKEGTGAPPIDMPPGGAPLDQKPPDNWL
jgi:hypothetical protein